MILCVDPEDDARAATTAALADTGFDARGVGSVAAATDAIEEGPDCVVTEYHLPDGTGLDVLQRTRDVVPDAACVLFTDTPIERIETAAVGDLVAEYLSKAAPDARERLVVLVDRSLAFHNQTAYPLPEDEDARLAALDRYVGDPEALDHSLDRLTELATALFEADAAAIGLVDAHEERFLSCVGVSFGAVDREDTVCTYAILDGGVTVVEDTLEDPRFEDNERLRAAGLRFYASAPLKTPDGRAIGTFCVFDSQPGPFDARQRELLGLLADEAMEQLELRRRLRTAEGG